MSDDDKETTPRSLGSPGAEDAPKRSLGNDREQAAGAWPQRARPARPYIPKAGLAAKCGIILFGLFVLAGSEADEPTDEIVLCDFQVPMEVAQANASFSVIFSVEIGASGRMARA